MLPRRPHRGGRHPVEGRREPMDTTLWRWDAVAEVIEARHGLPTPIDPAP
jgi:hypothetical protein